MIEVEIELCRRLGGSASHKIRKVKSDIAGLQGDPDSWKTWKLKALWRQEKCQKRCGAEMYVKGKISMCLWLKRCSSLRLGGLVLNNI